MSYEGLLLQAKNTSIEEHGMLKKGIWVYILLLILEGALRKWVLPSLATPLLIVRDPVAIILILISIKENIFPKNIYITGAFLITIFSFIATLVFGHGNLIVAVYGARIFLIQLPVLFIIGHVFTFEDVKAVGRTLVYIAPVMTLLMALQFYSPQSSWVNRGVGGDVQGAGFSGAMGYFRPSGTFSFISGLTAFYSLVGSFIFYFWLDNQKYIKIWILTLATACMFAAIPLSISRTLLFQIILTMIFVVIAVIHVPKFLPKLFLALIGGVIIVLVLSTLNSFQTAQEVFLARFTSANKTEKGLSGTLGNRFLGGMLNAVSDNDGRLEFWGKGIGMGTNAGAKLMTGKKTFLIAEGEWGRLIGEMGLILGLCMIALRMHLTLRLSYHSFLALKRENFLPWFLISFAFVNILQGQWSQPSALGFSVLLGGLIIAALKEKHELNDIK